MHQHLNEQQPSLQAVVRMNVAINTLIAKTAWVYGRRPIDDAGIERDRTSSCPAHLTALQHLHRLSIQMLDQLRADSILLITNRPPQHRAVGTRERCCPFECLPQSARRVVIVRRFPAIVRLHGIPKTETEYDQGVILGNLTLVHEIQIHQLGDFVVTIHSAVIKLSCDCMIMINIVAVATDIISDDIMTMECSSIIGMIPHLLNYGYGILLSSY
mmetsp:Transcript_23294/g.66013  ORF Transcript_23294/g.66013 Transcript_23294/m.66013 type:complete len:215 (-) Transcript_23294:830-1474(-)